jgi:hypothetical protein
MPIPVSATVKTSVTLPRLPGAMPAVKTTVPSLVNFTALSARFSSAARRRRASPATMAGRSSAIVVSALSSLLPARAVSAWPTACASARGENGSLRNESPAASALAASTINVVSAARWSAPLLMAFAHSRSRGPRLDEARSSASATMPVSGVRTSWAMPASAASIARGDGGLPARGRDARRFFVLRLTLRLSLRRCFAIAPRPSGRTMARKQASIEPDPMSDVGRGRAALSQFAQTRGGGRFRQLLAVGVEDEPVVMVARLRVPEQRLQQPVHAG